MLSVNFELITHTLKLKTFKRFQVLRKDVKEGLETEKNDRLRERETFYEDMDRVCTGSYYRQ